LYVFSEWGEAGNYETLSSITAATGFTLSKLNTTAIEGLKGLRCRAVLITVETASIVFTEDGTTPTTTTLGGTGHLLIPGEAKIITGQGNVKNFLCINAAAGSGATVHCTFYF
jgi:hypothetical protein